MRAFEVQPAGASPGPRVRFEPHEFHAPHAPRALRLHVWRRFPHHVAAPQASLSLIHISEPTRLALI
eukprot:4144632-Alexandrium_andersonii.AAC.1